MYLDNVAVEDTFRIIKEYSSSGSWVVFDYIYASILREENLYYGENEIYRTVKNANESWTFGIEKGEIKKYLHNRGFNLLEHYNASDLEEKFFMDDNILIGRINWTHCITLAATK